MHWNIAAVGSSSHSLARAFWHPSTDFCKAHGRSGWLKPCGPLSPRVDGGSQYRQDAHKILLSLTNPKHRAILNSILAPLSMRRVYLDYNATTPVDRDVLDAMLPFFTEG